MRNARNQEDWLTRAVADPTLGVQINPFFGCSKQLGVGSQSCLLPVFRQSGAVTFGQEGISGKDSVDISDII